MSWGAVVSRKTLGNLTIPPNSLEHFYNTIEEPYMLVIFNPQKSSLKIEVFPVSTKIVLKMQLVLTSFSQAVFKEITEILQDLDLTRIYTSGICLHEGLCIYEAYIEKDKLKVPPENVIAKFQKLSNIKDVSLINLD